MAISAVPLSEKRARYRASGADDTDDTPLSDSAVSWSAIAAGGAAAASLSLILLILGVGLGLSSVSPWFGEGIRAATFGVSTIVWLTLTQLLASGLGGYLAGRLRTRWEGVHSDEVYFRDTAHGFLAWAVASIATAALLTSAIGSILGGGAQAGAAAVGSAATLGANVASTRMGASSDEAPMAYFIDSLFRRDVGAPANSGVDPTSANALRQSSAELAEVGRIFMHTSRNQSLPPEDVRYVAQMLVTRTGMSQAEAEKRVSEIYARAQTQLNDAEIAAKDAADKARKLSAYGALWLFVSLLTGAFFASWAATLGGKERDH